MKLQGKTVLITGGAKRIGREIALTLAKRGAAVIVHYRNSRQKAQDLQKQIRDLRGECFIVQADFFSRSGPVLPAITGFLREVYRTVPAVDVLVNNASLFYPTPIEKISEKDWDELMTVNLKAPFFLARQIGLRMKQEGAGKIINLVDWTATSPRARYVPYAVSKAGLIAATQGLAKNLAPEVQVMGIAPGPILPAEHASPEEREAVRKKSLLKRYGDPKDIAEAVRFLIEGTDFMTGTVMTIDGGASLV